MAAVASGKLVAADTSSLQRYLAGAPGDDVAAVSVALEDGSLCLPPIVLAEALSDPGLTPSKGRLVRALPLLEIVSGYWERAGLLRGTRRATGHKAFLPDVLIAQCCIDNKIPIITYDRDFRHFIAAGLKLVV